MIHQHPRILLGMKKRGFGAGRWNGFGGKVEKGESIEKSARREVKEEAGIEIEDLNKVGIIEFQFRDDSKILEVHIFKSENFLGKPQESEEMKPQWFHINKIPFEKMWPDDVYWIPMFLKGKKFRGKFLFNKPSTSEETSIILEKELLEVKEI